MDLMPILDAALKAVGETPSRKTVSATALEKARQAIRMADERIGAALGEGCVLSVALNSEGPHEMAARFERMAGHSDDDAQRAYGMAAVAVIRRNAEASSNNERPNPEPEVPGQQATNCTHTA